MENAQLDELKQATVYARELQAEMEAVMNKFSENLAAGQFNPLTEDDFTLVRKSNEAWDKVRELSMKIEKMQKQ